MQNKQLNINVKNGEEGIFIKDYFENNLNNSILYIAKNDKEIFALEEKLQWFFPSIKILKYRSWDQIPYDNVSPSKEIQSERIETLYNLINNKSKKILLSSVNAITQKTVNKDFIKNNFINISDNKEVNYSDLINNLINLGFTKTSVVREKSEFAIRGSIIDIFLVNYENPIRIDFINNKIDSIFEFDFISQKRLRKIKDQILINPSSELLLNNTSLNIFRKNYRKIFNDYRNSEIYNIFSELSLPPGGENFLPLFNTKLTSIFDYINNFDIILNYNFKNDIDLKYENLKEFYEARTTKQENFYLPPKYLFLSKTTIQNNLNKFNTIKIKEFNSEIKNNKFYTKTIENLSSIKKEIDFKFIAKFFEINKKNKIVICVKNKGTINRIKKILREQLYFDIKIINNFQMIDDYNDKYITTLEISNSLQYKNYVFLNEKTLFGYTFSTTSNIKNSQKEIFFEEINKLTKNSILVHSEYGFCKFIDIRKIKIDYSLHDCVELEFDENQKLFLPIENLNFITKYGNDDNKNIKLDKLGSAHWQKRKAIAKNKIKEISKQLMSTAARRLNSKSFNIDINNSLYERFSSTFPFVETDDQIKAIDDIKEDFKKKVPSDRLVVGDVAFGKTEVILRAIFIASKSNLQSLVLVPTTLLSRQHYINFSRRLSSFDIKVAQVSRFISDKEKNQIISELIEGNINVVIGTHALLNRDIKFKKLGLIIYDEEQKLGTKQKEIFKTLYPRAHVISLSATPIPRTLSLSLSGIRDLSLILTAPYQRLSVRTYIAPYDELTIIEAIKREVYGRKNSVYYVTPRTKDIFFIEKFLKEKLPEIKYITAHGKLKAEILEKRITQFYEKKVDLMISTNIIESGLDLPHVNTIIVHRSNLFSLASLYQLKGRVGRSNIRGYAYLTYNEKEITKNSRKRLNVINTYEEIGSGFNIASHDLDLRGSGSIIGEEQSGFIKEVGSELYHQMLEEEILILKKDFIDSKEKIIKNRFEPNIKIPEEIFIPDEYIDDIDIKMSIYKRISNISNNDDSENLINELIDRFGNLPIEVENLFKLIEIKILCLKNNIEKIDFGRKGILISFFENKPIYPEKILNIIAKDSQIVLRNDQKIFYNFFGILKDNRFDLLKKIINKISKS